jgi:glycosyltransferase involved in cell wall biosynthesis
VPAFTVFTPTLDRAHTLQRVHDSLVAQTFRDFEWLVVDDGSTDETLALLDGWQRAASFPIRVIAKARPEGKYEAMRTAVAEARGTFFLTLDSDDSCVPTALERFHALWESIPQDARYRFSAVTGLCVDEHGRAVGSAFPTNPTDSNSLEIRYRFRVRGEKWGFQRTDILREVLAEVGPLPGFVPEGIVWDRIARRFQTRYVNEPLRVYHQDQPVRLSAATDRKAQAPGAIRSYGAALTDNLEWLRYAPLDFLYEAAQFVRFSLHAGRGIRQQSRGLQPAALVLWLAAFLPGVSLYLADISGLRHGLGVVRNLRRGRARGAPGEGAVTPPA